MSREGRADDPLTARVAEQGGLAQRSTGLAAFLLALMAMQAIAQHSYGTLAPFIRADLGASRTDMGLVAGALYLGTATAAFTVGGWVDRWHPRTVVRVTGCGIAVALGVVAAAPVVGVVMAGYLLVGLGRGAVPPLSDRLAYERAPVRSRGVVFGIKQTGTPIGSVAAAMLLPPLAEAALGWRGAVLVTALVVVAGVAALQATLAVAAPARPPVVTEASRPVERPASSGGMPLVRRLSAVMLFSLGLGIFMACAMTFLTLFLVDAGGLSPVRAARWFAVFGVGGAVGRAAWGWMSDRLFGGRRAPALVLSATAGGLLAILLGVARSLVLAVPFGLSMGLFGFLAQGWVGIVRAHGAELAGPGASGRAGGLLLGSMMLGGLVGPPVFGWLVDRTGDYTAGWSAMGALAMVTALTVLPAVRRERHAASAAVPIRER